MSYGHYLDVRVRAADRAGHTESRAGVRVTVDARYEADTSHKVLLYCEVTNKGAGAVDNKKLKRNMGNKGRWQHCVIKKLKNKRCLFRRSENQTQKPIVLVTKIGTCFNMKGTNGRKFRRKWIPRDK